MDCDCSKDQVVIFFDGTLTKESAGTTKDTGEFYLFHLLKILVRKLFQVSLFLCMPDCAQGEERISPVYLVSTKGLWLLTTESNFSMLPSRGPSFLLCLPFLPFSQMIFPLLLDSLIFLSVENELVQRAHCMGLIVLLSQ